MKSEKHKPMDLPLINGWVADFKPQSQQAGGVQHRKYRVRLDCMLRCTPVIIIEAENEEQAKVRALDALSDVRAHIETKMDSYLGGLVGTSEPVDPKIIEVSFSPDGLVHLEREPTKSAVLRACFKEETLPLWLGTLP